MFKIDEKTMFMPKINIKNLIRLKNTKQPRELHIILGNKAFQKYGEIEPIFHIQFHSQLNGADDLSFTVYKTVNGKTCRLWNELVNFRLIWVKEYNEWFQIKVAIDESEPITKKIITATSLCEAELSQRLLTIEINTPDDIKRADYINPTVFYNPNETDCSLLHRVLKDKCSDYTIQYVDETLYNVQRSFSADNVSVYDFLTGTVATELGCLFLFDTNNRSIYIYDMKTTCLECGYHNEQDFKICPECGCTAIHFPYGKDTNILIDKSTIGSNINLEADTDSIKTCFYIAGGDDTINATLKNISPNGTNQILYFNEDIQSDMPKELVDCLNAYQNLSNHYEQEEIYNLSSLPIDGYNEIITALNNLYPSKKWEHLETSYTGFANLTNALYNALDLKMYLENSMMPVWVLEEKDAKSQLKLLTPSALSPVSVIDISIVSKYTVNNAVLAMAKCIIDTSMYKVETFDYDFQSQTWTGKFRIQSYTNENDKAENPKSISITISDDSTTYIHQKIKRAIHRLDNNHIQDIYDIDDKEEFERELIKHCKSNLHIFSEAIQIVLDVLQEENCSLENSPLYKDLYEPYYKKKTAIDKELKIREGQIQVVETVFDSIQAILSTIHNTLNFHQYVGDDLWKLLLSYMREDNYTNENYISDGLSNAQIIQKCEELKEVAKKELMKSGNQQYSISETLTNLLLIKNEQGNCIFEPILDDFCLGNFIRTKIDGQVYKMRLIDIHIDYDNLDTLSVTFSDITKGINNLSDRLSNTIAQVSSMSTSYSAIKKQAEQGQQANYSIEKLRTDGLNSAQFNVFNTHSTIEMDEHGLLSRGYDDVNNFYSDEQLRINNANIIMTKDNWRTTILAIGKQTYTLNKQTYTIYGVNADTVLAGQIISGDIYSSDFTTNEKGGLIKGIHMDLNEGLLDSVGIHMDFNDGSFSLADEKIVYANNHLTFSDVTINWEHTNSPSISDIDNLDSTLNILNNVKEALHFDFTTTIDENSIISPYIGGGYLNIGDSKTSVVINPLGIGETDKNNYDVFGVYNNANNKKTRIVGIDTDGKAYFNGEINTQKGVIGGWNITSEYLCKDMNQYRVYIQPPSNNDTWVFSVQELYTDNNYYGKWYVTASGKMYASDLVSPNVNITGGTIHIKSEASEPSSIQLETWVDNSKDKYQMQIKGHFVKVSDLTNEVNTSIQSVGLYIHDPQADEHFTANANGLYFTSKTTSNNTKSYWTPYACKLHVDNRVDAYTGLTYFGANQFQAYNQDGILKASLSQEKLIIFTTSNTIAHELRNDGYCYFGSTPVIGSDKNIKNSIEYLDINKISDFIYSLNPVQFKYNNELNNQCHHGLIAQEVKTLLESDSALYVENIDTNGNKTCGLRYEELIADLIATVQSQNERIKQLEERL